MPPPAARVRRSTGRLAPPLLAAALLFASCSRQPEGGGGMDDAQWLLSASGEARFERVAKHLRGLDVAMWEVGYRYGELHWAGADRNWELATYHIGKMRTAMTNAVERRPKRAESAKMLEPALAGLEEAVTRKDPALFSTRFEQLTRTCNACHLVEQVGFMQVRPPATRGSPMRAPGSDDAGVTPPEGR